MTNIVVVGAGQAGASLVAELRRQGFEGDITMVGEEPIPPYQRPPLSKGYLLGDLSLDRMLLRPQAFYSEQQITLHLNSHVESINRRDQTVKLNTTILSYDKLVLTTGSIPKQLPDSLSNSLKGVFVVRTLADVDAMAPYMKSGTRALVVGGGYIGLEVAAVASSLGVQVTIIESSDRILQRVAAPQTSDYFRTLHGEHGVTILESAGLKQLIGNQHVSAAELNDGRRLDVDFVIVGIGITPDTTLAELSGLKVDNGIAVDANGRTSDPNIWAAGDCCSFPHKGGRLRLESVPNAIDQGSCVARNILGKTEDYLPKPWFWSDQYDTKLQIAGLNSGYDQIYTRMGSGRAISFWYYKGEHLLAVDAMNDPRGYMIGKRLIEKGESPAPALVSDPDVDLRALARS
ncbi:MAG: FAD-dependent oxidoreductase [Aestuariivita sp.]|nr:FAD-dependent oxidoreductase [Aestuariivita sp.]MCY4345474.1 FAD-dependent oxidoreductase [Aestuariivita sp.]